MLFQSTCPFSKYPSNKDICDKCRIRNNSESSDEMKSLNVKNAAKGQKVSVPSKTLVAGVCALIVLALFLFVAIWFLRPLGLSGTINPNHQPFFVSLDDVFFNYEHPDGAQTKGGDTQEFIINPENLCSVDATLDIKLLILVKSLVSNFDYRQAIRDTWGSLTTKTGPYRLGFIVGSTMNSTASRLLQEESETYRDVIQCNLEDTFENRIIKSIAMFKWVAEFCPHVRFFLKADDDIYINFAVLSTILSKEVFQSDPNFITGFLQNTTDEKVYFSEDDYGEEFYPSYISGSAYLTTGDLSKNMYKISNEITPLPVEEDVFITGLCARKIGAALIHDGLFRSDKPYPAWVLYSGIATGNGLNSDEIYKIWKEMLYSFAEDTY